MEQVFLIFRGGYSSVGIEQFSARERVTGSSPVIRSRFLANFGWPSITTFKV